MVRLLELYRLEASVSSLKLTNRHISRELADIKTKLDLYKMRREGNAMGRFLVDKGIYLYSIQLLVQFL